MAKFLIANPGFELGDNGDWFNGPGFTIEKDIPNARSGSWLAKFVGSSQSSVSVGSTTNFIAVRPGNKLSISAYYDGEDATAGAGQVNIVWADKDVVLVVTDFSANEVAFGQTGYLQSVLTDSVAPDRAKFGVVQVRIVGSPDGSTWYADDAVMTGESIESIPATAIISAHRVVPADTIGVFDPLIGTDKFTEFNAGMSDKWSGVYTFIPSVGADLGELVSFIRRLGRTERFFAFDPDRTIPFNGIVNDMTVDGPITNGTNKIPVKAGPVSSTALIAGDYMEVKDQYFQLQRDLEIGPEGTGEAIVFPAVRSTLADGEDVITDNPKMVARITSDLDWRRVEARPVDLTISWEEV